MISGFGKTLLSLILVASLFLPNIARAEIDYGVGRERSCSSSGEPESLDFNPTSGGKDVEFVLTNPVCLTVIATSYAATKAAIALMNSACGNNAPIRVKPTPLLDLVDTIKAGAKCSSEKRMNCCAATAFAVASLSSSIAALGIIYGLAEDVYKDTNVCGSEWMKPNVSKYDLSASGRKQDVKRAIEGYIRSKNYTSTGLNPANKTYREWFHDGMEYEDNPFSGEVCRDPSGGRGSRDKWGDYPKQKYYLKGIEAGNYNCRKYLIVPGQTVPDNVDVDEMRKAYECCVNRSQNYMCLDYTNKNLVGSPRTPTFCKKGENCTMVHPEYKSGIVEAPVVNPKAHNGDIWFTIKNAYEGLLCAETYSLCPYNFAIGGGSDHCNYYRDGVWNSSQNRWIMITQEQIDAGECAQNSEIRDTDCNYNEKAGKCKNYCQYLVHCTKTASEGFIYQSGLGSPYFAQACIDFVGDSQNNTGFNTGIIMGKQMHFTAPIAQCIKETLENLFYNRAGHSKCLTYGEYPDANGDCASNLYVTDRGTGDFTFVYKKGNKVMQNSFFEKIQQSMSLIIKMGITLAIVFYGVNLLLWKTSLGDKKSILMFIFKIALVMYFCASTAWQDVFFRGFYDASMSLANIMFKIEVMKEPIQQDGCQFGDVVLSDGTTTRFGVYPDGKSYLAIWDTIDCKMMRYLGFGPQVTDANIASLIITTFFIGPAGIYFAMSVMIFGFFLVSLAIRALHIFVSSAAAIILLVFISPLIIPCAMFERTKKIFDGWVSKMMSFCLQPMILFAYVAIFVTIMDQTLIGSATFHGNPPTKTMSCESSCVDSNGNVVPYDGDQAPACDNPGEKIVNPLDDSVACLLNFQDFGTWKAFQIVGIGVPMAINLFEENVKQRILTLLKGALVMFLLYAFMDEIPGIIDALVGGGLAKKGQADAFSMLGSATGMVKGIAERGATLAGKASGGVARSAANAAEYGGNQGKQAKDAEGDQSNSDFASSSKGGGNDMASSSSISGDDPVSATGSAPADSGSSEPRETQSEPESPDSGEASSGGAGSGSGKES